MHETQPSPSIENHEYLSFDRRIIAFIGPEGSGKSTIAEKLASEIHKPLIIAGNILRDLAKNDQTVYGDACRLMFAQYTYLDPQLFTNILEQRFKQKDLENGFIIDGALRSVEGVRGFQPVIERTDRVFPIDVIHLRIPSWMSIERLVTAENARKREDDTPSGVLHRLSNYYDHLGLRTTTIKSQKNWRFHQVNATGTIDATYRKVQQVLSTK